MLLSQATVHANDFLGKALSELSEFPGKFHGIFGPAVTWGRKMGERGQGPGIPWRALLQGTGNTIPGFMGGGEATCRSSRSRGRFRILDLPD
jgi:hypothetical protein